MKSSWRPVTNGVLQESILGSILSNIFINDLGDEPDCTFTKFAGDKKLRRVADTAEGCAAIQRRDIWTWWRMDQQDLMKLDKGKCKVLYLGRNNLIHQYRMGPVGWKAALQKRSWLLVDKKLTMPSLCPCGKGSQQYGGLHEEGDPSPLLSPGETTAGVPVQLWAPQHKREMELLP